MNLATYSWLHWLSTMHVIMQAHGSAGYAYVEEEGGGGGGEGIACLLLGGVWRLVSS